MSLFNQKSVRQPNPSAANDSKGSNVKALLPPVVAALAILLLVLYLCKVHFGLFRGATAPSAIDAASYDCTVTLAAVGDIALTNDQLKDFLQADGEYDYGACFDQVSQSIAGAHIAVGNFEGNAGGETDADSFNYPDSFLAALERCGFDLLQTANSRSIQNGISAIASTKAAIAAHGMVALGTYASQEERSAEGGVVIKEINHIKIAFVAFTKGLNNMRLPDGSEGCVNLLYQDYDTKYSKVDKAGITGILEAAKAESPDFIVAMVHWGSENDSSVSDTQEQIAEILISNGVDVIIGSHSHIVGKLEQRSVTVDGKKKEVYIAYSLGDFLTATEGSKNQIGCILGLTFCKDSASGSTAITDFHYTPTFCTVPSEELEISHYAILDTMNSIKLYEEQYYDRVSQPLYEKLKETLETLKTRTESDYQIQK